MSAPVGREPSTPWKVCNVVNDPAEKRCPIEVSVGALDQPPIRIRSVRRRSCKTVQRSQHASLCDLENCSGRSPTGRRPVKVPIRALNQPRRRSFPIEASEYLLAKTVQSREHASRCDLKHRASAVRSVCGTRPVVVPVIPFDQVSVRSCPVRTLRLYAETIKRGYRSSRSNFVNRAALIKARAMLTAIPRCPIPIPVGGLQHP